MPIPARVIERAATRYEVDENGCWISTYSTGSHGYAQVGWQNVGDRGMVLVHRAAWEHHHGTEPEGTVDHTCHVRPCVNPAHLRDLSNVENARRNSVENDYPLGLSCKRGHDPALRVRRRRGNRTSLTCKGCERIWQQAKRARRAARTATT